MGNETRTDKNYNIGRKYLRRKKREQGYPPIEAGGDREGQGPLSGGCLVVGWRRPDHLFPELCNKARSIRQSVQSHRLSPGDQPDLGLIEDDIRRDREQCGGPEIDLFRHCTTPSQGAAVLNADAGFPTGVAIRLDEEGILPKRGRRWIHTTVKGILARNAA